MRFVFCSIDRAAFRRLHSHMPRRLRLLIEPSDYVLRNVGDMAMMQAATERLADVFPGAVIQVLTRDPHNLKTLCPQVDPMDARGRSLWLALLLPSISDALPGSAATTLRLGLLRAASIIIRILRPSVAREIARFLHSVRTADALIVSGMGGITDAFPRYAFDLLDTMALAIAFDVPVFMVGQGIGPLQSQRLRSRAAAVLPKVQMIALREGRASEPNLWALGVAPERIVTTGDDAVEMAFCNHPQSLGDGIGFNLRMADYSAVSLKDGRRVAEIVRMFAQPHGAPVIPLPVSRAEEEADMETFRRLMPDAEGATSEIAVASDLIEETKRCRIAIAGSYHAAVFALSIGVPTIGIAHSAYYVDKFVGLKSMFGAGCAWVDLKAPDAEAKLSAHVERLWEKADELRPGLLAAAERQVASGHAVYRQIADFVNASVRNA